MEFRWIGISLFLTALLHFTVEEIKNDDDDKVTSRCTVRTYEQNTCRVKWVYEGKDVDEQLQTVGTQHLLCYTDVTFETNHFTYTSGHNSLQCEVSTANNKQLFPFRPQPSGRKPVEYNHDRESRTTTTTPEQPTSAPRPTGNRETAETTPTPETKEASDDCRCCSGLDFFMLALRVSELVLVSLLTVLLFRAGGNQRPPDENKQRADPYLKKKTLHTIVGVVLVWTSSCWLCVCLNWSWSLCSLFFSSELEGTRDLQDKSRCVTINVTTQCTMKMLESLQLHPDLPLSSTSGGEKHLRHKRIKELETEQE
ncbi:uncharacterized protein LOC141801628 [Halichoeres trimaculatus]|uniref:uncharacterized protein LOC141801628 n=1 Tax=Halichoeres trimaculatus TaxID=147232 RepID=UPI003D9DF76B